jgi:hypothetical protein
MMLAANVPETIRYKVHSEAFKTATLLDGLMPVEITSITKTRYEHCVGRSCETVEGQTFLYSHPSQDDSVTTG